MATDLYFDGVIIPGSLLTWSSVRASGPGGQNVNKVATKVQLRFDVAACDTLSDAAKRRLLARTRQDADGQVLIVSQATRNRVRNLADARERLSELIREALIEPKPRKPRKKSRRANARRVEAKRRNADKKRGRQRVDY